MSESKIKAQQEVAAQAVDAQPSENAELGQRCRCGRHTIGGAMCSSCANVESALPRRPSNGRERLPVPLAVQETLRSPGRPLTPALRRAMELGFTRALPETKSSRLHLPTTTRSLKFNRSGSGDEQQAQQIARQVVSAGTSNERPSRSELTHDFSRVRLYEGPRAAQAAETLGAQAFSVGNQIVFGSGFSASQTGRGADLLAHELTHVVQQSFHSSPAPLLIQRRVIPNYEDIERRLTYRFLLDWVITDQEAREVLDILSGLSDRDLADTVAAMDREGLVERLLDNTSEDDLERYAVLIGKINRHRSVSDLAERIIDRLSYGFFDWAITDEDAREALHSLMGLDYQQLRTLVAKMVNEKVFDRLMDQLPEQDHKRYAAFIKRLRRIRDEFLELVKTHVAYLRSKPGGAGRVIRKTVKETGYGGSKPKWPDLDPEVQDDWEERAEAVVAELRKSVVMVIVLNDIVKRSKFAFEPEEVERNNAYAYVRGKNTLYFGTLFVANAEEDIRNVWQSVAHELGGHEEFGRTWSWEIMQATLARLSPEERAEAFKGVNSIFSAYGYLETEIYAELREMPHRIPTSGGDVPETKGEKKGDVHKQLLKIKKAFGPDVGRTIVVRLYYRVMGDPRVSDRAKRVLYDEVQRVFGLFPLPEPVGP